MNMTDTQTLELAPAEAKPQAIVPFTPQPEQKPQITPAQAKVEAIAALTMAAYEKAATLDLTPEEAAALQAEFPDDAFQPGAAGKEHLIYIEHAHLRDRFNSVFGMGKWAIVPRNRWAEAFRTTRGDEGSRIYVEAMLVVRGCFVGEAVGAMEYYPKNASQNYGDAVEGAKTAAFRRCAKEFGVGLQAWKKEFCEGWWQRRRNPRASKTPQAGSGGYNTPPKAEKRPTEPAKAQGGQSTPKFATDATRNWMIDELKDMPDLAKEYFEKCGQLLPTETLYDLPLRFVPISKEQMRLLRGAICDFGNGAAADPAFPANPESPMTEPPPQDPGPSASEDYGDLGPQAEPWRTFPMPYGKHAGTPLEKLAKNYLFGLWANYTVEKEYNGKAKSPDQIAKDELFRLMLNGAGKHYEFTKKEQ